MKKLFLYLAFGRAACSEPVKNSGTITEPITQQPEQVAAKPDSEATTTEKTAAAPAIQSSTYSNTRFRDVTVSKTADNTYRIKGKGQIFEASFGWVIEDGHNELQSGHQMTDAGAPEWGNFEFTVEAKKDRPNSTLTLILFEVSAKDRSRQYELPIPLN